MGCYGAPWKSNIDTKNIKRLWFGRCISFQKWQFVVSMLNFGGVWIEESLASGPQRAWKPFGSLPHRAARWRRGRFLTSRASGILKRHQLRSSIGRQGSFQMCSCLRREGSFEIIASKDANLGLNKHIVIAAC